MASLASTASPEAVGPALVLLHGFTHTGASWQPVIDRVGKPYRPLAPDIRGHGSASQRDPVSLRAVIGDIAALAPASFTLAGYSMGGRIALHVALALGARVRRLVLIGASPGIADRSQRAARRIDDERLAAELEDLSIEQFAQRWAQRAVLAGLPAAVAGAVHEDRLRSTPEGLARALRALGTGALPSLWGRLAELAMPVTLLAGERDVKFARIAVEMAARIPAGALAIVPDAGHAVHLEAPALVAALLAGEPPGAAG
ncbi:MAG: 2-succinyl-6-hydroxy-2,4-cyclohexadiene-1-carboxylate synthase [Solirubrobacteraceae bacterium]